MNVAIIDNVDHCVAGIDINAVRVVTGRIQIAAVLNADQTGLG